MGPALDEHDQDEDAFFLNVWSPNEADALPVIFFIHGGAWMTGGGSVRWYDGTQLADRGVVVVTVNYRLGPLGHLRSESAQPVCLPLDDLLIALRWVQDNIRGYGGDPDNVTVVGQSAGGWYGHALSVMPEAEGLLARVAHLSAGMIPPWTETKQQSMSDLVRKRVGALDGAPVPELLEAGARVLKETPREFGFMPAAYLPVEEPRAPRGVWDVGGAARGLHARSVFVRYTRDESGTFLHAAPERNPGAAEVARFADRARTEGYPGSLATEPGKEYEAVRSMATWLQFGRHAIDLGNAYAASGVPTTSRRFDEPSNMDGVGAGHCFDLPFQFGNLSQWHDAPMLRGIAREDFDRTSDVLMTDLINFVSGAYDGVSREDRKNDE